MMGPKLNALIIDHYDSFTYNIKDWLSSGDFDVTVCKWDSEVGNFDRYHLIVLSPGPGRPTDYAKTEKLINQQLGKVPIFGICLGMQLLLSSDGEKIERINFPSHGKASSITTAPSILFNRLPEKVNVGRYHSLGASDSKKFKPTATYEEIVMAIEDESRAAIGVQFHPESFLTEHNVIMRTNLHEWVTKWHMNQ